MWCPPDQNSAESPPVSAQAAAKICGRLISTPSLHLVVGRFLGFALGTRQDALVLCIILRLGHLHRSLLLSNLLLSLTPRSLRPHLPCCQCLELLRLHLFEHIWVLLEVEEDTEKTLLVPPTEQAVFPRRLFSFVLVFIHNDSTIRMCHGPVVHCELCIPRLDTLARVQLLKLPSSVITKGILCRHSVDGWRTRHCLALGWDATHFFLDSHKTMMHL